MDLLEKKVSLKYGELCYYHTKVENSKSTYLFIHGSGAGKFFFPTQFEKHKDSSYSFKQYSWLVPSLMGYESSDEPIEFEAYSMEQYAQDLLDLLIYEEVHSVTILGHSMGGMIGILLLNLIFEDKHIKVDAFYNMEGPIIKEDLEDEIGRKPFENFQAEKKKVLDDLQRKIDTGDRKSQHIYKMMNMNPDFTVWAAFTHFTRLIDKTNLFEMIVEISNKTKTPIYFVYGVGQNSEYYPSRKEILKSDFNVIDVPNAGHNMFIDNPDFFWPKVFGN
jgi:pimeloyl-ACP methyl ester carboxylesterase